MSDKSSINVSENPLKVGGRLTNVDVIDLAGRQWDWGSLGWAQGAIAPIANGDHFCRRAHEC